MTALSVLSVLTGVVLTVLGYMAVYQFKIVIYTRKEKGELRDISQQAGSDLVLIGVIAILGGGAALLIPRIGEGVLLYEAVIVLILCISTLVNINK